MNGKSSLNIMMAVEIYATGSDAENRIIVREKGGRKYYESLYTELKGTAGKEYQPEVWRR